VRMARCGRGEITPPPNWVMAHFRARTSLNKFKPLGHGKWWLQEDFIR